MAKLSPYTARRQMVTLTTESFDAIEDYVRWAERFVPAQLPRAMDMLVRYMAMVNQGLAQQMSAGPYDPQQRSPQLAWKVPVRRISEKYYVGWKTRRVGVGVWQLYNDSREAFFIEFGIHTSERRVRRPIRKLSLRKTLTAMMRTQVYHRIWSEIYYDARRHRRHTGAGFTQTLQSPAMGRFAGPSMGRRLP